MNLWSLEIVIVFLVVRIEEGNNPSLYLIAVQQATLHATHQFSSAQLSTKKTSPSQAPKSQILSHSPPLFSSLLFSKMTHFLTRISPFSLLITSSIHISSQAYLLTHPDFQPSRENPKNLQKQSQSSWQPYLPTLQKVKTSIDQLAREKQLLVMLGAFSYGRCCLRVAFLPMFEV